MALQEQFGSREITYTEKGAEATRIFIGDWADWRTFAPAPGSPFPGDSMLRCCNVKATPTGQGNLDIPGLEYTGVRVVCTYILDYTKPRYGAPPKVTYDFCTEVLNTAAGRQWTSTSRKIAPDVLTAAVVYPSIEVSIAVVLTDPNWTAIHACLGKINNADLVVYDMVYSEDGSPVGTPGADSIVLINALINTLLFEGVKVDTQWDYSQQCWLYSMNYKFLWRPRSHNLAWRMPHRDFDATWKTWKQNADGTFIYLDAGGWDTTDPLFYETADFTPLLAGGGQTPDYPDPDYNGVPDWVNQ